MLPLGRNLLLPLVAGVVAMLLWPPALAAEATVATAACLASVASRASQLCLAVVLLPLLPLPFPPPLQQRGPFPSTTTMLMAMATAVGTLMQCTLVVRDQRRSVWSMLGAAAATVVSVAL